MCVAFVGHECENVTLSVDSIDFRRETVGEKDKIGVG
jgi:hypothetical protein